MVKQIILLGDDKNRIKEAERTIQKFSQNIGWECEVKGFVEKEFCAKCDREILSKELGILTITNQGTIIRIDTKEIRHVESHNHKVFICTEADNYIVYEKLSDVLKRLPEEFVQCHKSFVVNMNYIVSIEGKEVVLRDGKRISISRSYNNHFKEKIEEYLE